MKIYPLGTNGFFPSFERQTMCFAVPFENILILLDAGSGFFRFVEPGGKKLLDSVKEVHIYLSHYHLDHTFGFYGGWKILKGKKVTVFGAEKEKVFSAFTRKYFPIDYEKEHAQFHWEKLSFGQNSLSGYTVNVRMQSHNTAGSLAFRFRFPNGEDFSYVTDSEPTRESVSFVFGTDLLLHEHYLLGEDMLKRKDARLEDHFLSGHTTTVGATMVAREGKVGRLVLIHHYPFAGLARLIKQEKVARSIFPATTLSQDLIPIPL
ncbi:hypothetical protein HYW55_06290 [Candidatus Gottesmanbacteria bacterium]|nr:hypothetical protein [Candidatus Gottesmanbacteria bacterium]